MTLPILNLDPHYICLLTQASGGKSFAKFVTNLLVFSFSSLKASFLSLYYYSEKFVSVLYSHNGFVLAEPGPDPRLKGQ
jgi:hypothetical protein